MKKHIIFTGSELTGKTLFAKMIFGGEKTAFINGKYFDVGNDYFALDLCKEHFNYETLIIDDIKENFKYESLYPTFFRNEMMINRICRESEVVKTPRLVIITNFTHKLLSVESLKSRYHVIDFDKDPVADLMKIIKEEKIIIKTHWE